MIKSCLFVVMLASSVSWAGPAFETVSEFRQCAQRRNEIVEYKRATDADKDNLAEYEENTDLLGDWIEVQRSIIRSGARDSNTVHWLNVQIKDYNARLKEYRVRAKQINKQIDQRTVRLDNFNDDCGRRQVSATSTMWQEVCIDTNAYALFCDEFKGTK